MGIVELIFSNIILLSIGKIASVYIIHVFLEKKINIKKIIIPTLIYLVLDVVWSSILSISDINNYGMVQDKTYILMLFFSYIFEIIYIRMYIKKLPIKTLFLTISIGSIINNLIYYLVIFIIRYFVPILWNIPVMYLEVTVATITSMTVIIVTYIVSKSKLFKYYKSILHSKILSIVFSIIYILVDILLYYYIVYMSNDVNAIEITIIFVLIGYIILFLLIGFLSREGFNKQKIIESEALVLQQQNYLSRLENIQQELRMVQHDYKNMITGLYAQASEGNIEAVKEYIDTKLLQVNHDVEEDIRQMNQLTQINLMELKGLLLVKIMEAEKQDVIFNLEVLNPVNEIRMDSGDLIRCLGILLDNALEEARLTKDKRISLLILKEANKVTIVVKNDLVDQKDLTTIWETGFSSKGPNRGLGLSNYRNILHTYDNIICETKIEENQFIQVLIIM